MKRHPIQPLELDPHGTLRFKSNAIVRHLLDDGPFDMNTIARVKFPVEDRVQFAQLIGYSLSGFGDLSYVSDLDYEAAEVMKDTGDPSLEARLKAAEAALADAKASLREGIARLYGIHPDNLDR